MLQRLLRSKTPEAYKEIQGAHLRNAAEVNDQRRQKLGGGREGGRDDERAERFLYALLIVCALCSERVTFACSTPALKPLPCCVDFLQCWGRRKKRRRGENGAEGENAHFLEERRTPTDGFLNEVAAAAAAAACAASTSYRHNLERAIELKPS